MKFLRKSTAVLLGALIGFAGVALAQTVYYGWNPVTGLETTHGTAISAGAVPVLSSTTTSCGTYATVNASLVGGASAFQVTANTTSCTLKFVFPSAAPNGYNCVTQDETTSTGAFRQIAHDTISCTVASTGATVSGDKILTEVNGF